MSRPTKAKLEVERTRADELRYAAERVLRLADADPPPPLPSEWWAALAKLRAAAAKMPHDEWER